MGIVYNSLQLCLSYDRPPFSEMGRFYIFLMSVELTFRPELLKLGVIVKQCNLYDHVLSLLFWENGLLLEITN